MATANAEPTASPGEGRHKYRILPALAPGECAALKGNIALHYVKFPIVRDEEGAILDGFARAEVAGALRYECPETVESGPSEANKRALVRALNLSHGQLGQAAKQKVIAEQLRETPRLSNRRIVRVSGVDHKTVVGVRAAMLGTGEIPLFDRLLGRVGKE